MKTIKGKLFILLIILISISSCIVDDVKSNDKQFINLYSDFLSSKDHRIFRSFERKNNIKINIYHFESKQLIEKIINEGYNCNADVILFKSIYHTNKLANKDKLQAFQSEKIEENIDIEVTEIEDINNKKPSGFISPQAIALLSVINMLRK